MGITSSHCRRRTHSICESHYGQDVVVPYVPQHDCGCK
jgi:hypothetical protein